MQLGKSWWLVVIGIVTGVKLVNLEMTPLFGDEATYCFWGTQVAHFGLTNSWEAMVTQAKIAPVLPFLQAMGWWVLPWLRPIFLCRSVSVFLSAAASALVFLLTLKLSRRPLVAWIAMLFYLLNPFSFFTDRTSLLEPGLNFFVLGVTYLVWLAVTRKKLRWVGVAIALLLVAVLTKLTALLIIPGLIGLVIFSPLQWKQRWWVSVGLMVASLGLLWLVTTTGLWAVFGYHAHAGFDISGMMRRALSNVHLTRSWYEQYLTGGFFILVLLGAWQLSKERQFGWLLFPVPILITYILLADSYFPRFLLLTMPFLAVIVGYSVRTRLGQAILAIVLLIWLYNDWRLVVQPTQATMAREDYFQFYQDWTSGGGILPALEFLSQHDEIETVILPRELLHQVKLYQQNTLLGLDLQLLPVELQGFDQSEMAIDPDSSILLSTSHHAWLTQTLSDRYSLNKIFASHGDESRSMLLYRLSWRR